MKLIFCRECRDIVKLTYDIRYCLCGKSSGHYLRDGLTAIISGEAVPIGISNNSFSQAIANRPEAGQGNPFEAFVIPRVCATVKQK